MRTLWVGLFATVVVMMGLGSFCWAGAAPEIDVATLAKALKNDKTAPFLLDVREPSEVRQGSIQGSVNIPLNDLPTRLVEVPKDKLVVVICRSGHRSARGASFLLDNGFTKVESLAGGMIAWTAGRT